MFDYKKAITLKSCSVEDIINTLNNVGLSKKLLISGRPWGYLHTNFDCGYCCIDYISCDDYSDDTWTEYEEHYDNDFIFNNFTVNAFIDLLEKLPPSMSVYGFGHLDVFIHIDDEEELCYIDSSPWVKDYYRLYGKEYIDWCDNVLLKEQSVSI